MFNAFVTMYRLLGKEKRLEVKKQWVCDLEEIFTEFIYEENIKLIDPASENILYMVEAKKVRDI